MAILTKIRKQTGLVIGAVAIGLLAFIFPWDRATQLFSGHKDPNVFGKVNGEAITRQEFNDLSGFMENQYGGQANSAMIQSQVWRNLVQNKLIEEKFNAAGLTLTDKMIYNLAKQSPMFANAPQFQDASGKFNMQKFQEEIKKIEDNPNPSNTVYQNWMVMKKSLGYQAMYSEYMGAYTAGLLTNKKELDLVYQNSINTANIEYVKLDYNAYSKTHPIKVSDEDIKAYIEKHKSLYKVDANRILDYSYFSAKPSPKDEQVSLEGLKKFLTNFVFEGDTIQAFSSVKNDSVYISQVSDKPFNGQYRQLSQLPSALQTWVKTASVGQLSAPYKTEDEYYVLSKLVATKPLDSIQIRSIVVGYTGSKSLTLKGKRNKEEAKKLADEIAAKLNANPNQFAALFNQYSEAPGSKPEGQWITNANPFPKEYSFLETAAAGKNQVVEIPNEGFNIINIEGRKVGSTVYKIADLAKEIKASDATVETARRNATKFIQEIEGKSSKDFGDVAKKNRFFYKQQKGVLRFGSTLTGVNSDQINDVIEWSFDSDRNLGDTEMFTLSDGSYLVARVSGIFDKGLADPSLVRENVELIVRNELLGKKLAAIVNSSNKSLDQLAAEYKTTKKSANVTFDFPSIEGANEPKVGGAAFGLKIGKQSKAIEGKSGVYVIVTKAINKGAVNNDKKQLRAALENRYTQTLPNQFLQTLYQDANIEDYRGQIINQQKKQGNH